MKVLGIKYYADSAGCPTEWICWFSVTDEGASAGAYIVYHMPCR